MYALQIVQRTYVKPSDVRYFLGYPLGNTWTYETPSGPMCKDHQTHSRVVGRSLLCPRVGGKLSLQIARPSSHLSSLFPFPGMPLGCQNHSLEF
jgi:hypothetical protein